MMTTLEYYLPDLLLASNAMLLAIASFAVHRSERRWSRVQESWKSPVDAALPESGDNGINKHMEATERLEQQLGELRRTIKVMDMKAPEQRPSVERILPIENAIRMARLGASIDDLTRNCGLNTGEARLMKKLHGNSRTAANGR